MATAPPRTPVITEHDLLAFQLSHFGDGTQPDNWFVDAETALHYYEPAAEDDALGYYDDGVKRTLTDEQIAMFRHSEIQQLLRERRLQKDEQDYQEREPERNGQGSPGSDASSLECDLVGLARPTPPASPHQPTSRSAAKSTRRRGSDSSLEGDLVGLARPPAQQQASRDRSSAFMQQSQSSRSDTSRSTEPSRRQRHEEVPYDQRHKRNWEDFIDENDPAQGSMTHRRIARQLDDAQGESVDLDYGDDEGPARKRAPPPKPPPGRRVVSYGDD